MQMRTEDGRSETPLHLAVKKGNLNLLRLMISEYNTPVVVQDANGLTPMHLAVQAKDIQLVRMIAQAAASQPLALAGNESLGSDQFRRN